MAASLSSSSDGADPWATSDSSANDSERQLPLRSGFELAGRTTVTTHSVVANNFFRTVGYRSKADITATVIYYHWCVQRGFTAIESDKR